MRFTKMQGCGNDYVYVDCTKGIPFDPIKTAIAVSNRNFGIGSDGLILICASDKADFRMRFFNDVKKGSISFAKALPDIADLTGKRGGIFKGFIKDATNAFKGLSGQMPRTNQYGYCCRCDTPSVQCPSCNAITHLSEAPHQGQIIVCSSCRKQMVFI